MVPAGSGTALMWRWNQRLYGPRRRHRPKAPLEMRRPWSSGLPWLLAAVAYGLVW